MNKSDADDGRHPALYDGLTGLPNILLTRELLERWISLAQRNDRILAVLELKVDVNGVSGSEARADARQRLYSAVSETLRHNIRQSDFGGIGEDGAFVITFGNLFSPGDANKVVTRLLRELRKRTPLELNEPKLTGGISLYPVDGLDADSLLSSARTARDLAAGNNSAFEFSSQRISHNIVQYTVLEERLLQAINSDELKVRYRPQYGLRSKRIESVEALIYWQHPELGMIPPAALVGLAEDLGLSIKVGTFVLEQAVASHRLWSRHSGTPVELLIYVPAPSFIDRRFVDIVEKLLSDSPVPPESLSLGLAESSMLRNPDKSSAVLSAFADIGIKLSVFGFGAGHSSLAGLLLYPIHSLTLDSAVTRNMLSDTRARLMVETTLAAAAKLNLPVTAGGLQSEEQAEWLRSLGCSRAQGPLYGQPVDAGDIGEMLQAETQREVSDLR